MLIRTRTKDLTRRRVPDTPRRDRFDRRDPVLESLSESFLTATTALTDLWEHAQRSFFCPFTTDPTLQDRHITAAADLSRAEIEHILRHAEQYRAQLDTGEPLHVMDGQVLATLFFEPSTRTRLSFESAMHRLGGQVISTADGRGSSSAVKGESIADTIRTVCSYADVIVQRHPALGSAAEAARAADRVGKPVPVINAGDGAGEHPTQALLDLYTMQRERGVLDGLRIVLAGDLKHGRTVHSLLKTLAHWSVHVTLAAPDALAMPRAVLDGLPDLNIVETDDLFAATESADVLYMTRVQKERFSDPADYERLSGDFIVDGAFMAARPNLTVMHPLPRVDEIAPEVDDLPNAAYFRQAQNGLYVRMALLALVKGRAL